MLENPLNIRDTRKQVVSRIALLRKYLFDLLIDMSMQVGRKISLNLNIPVDNKIPDFFGVKEISLVHHFLFSFQYGFAYFPCEI